jgi:hypothetical protein
MVMCDAGDGSTYYGNRRKGATGTMDWPAGRSHAPLGLQLCACKLAPRGAHRESPFARVRDTGADFRLVSQSRVGMRLRLR